MASAGEGDGVEDEKVARGKAAAALHDRWNVYAIPPLVALTVLALVLGIEVLHSVLSWGVLFYIVVDFIWTALVPHSQPNAFRCITILVHHAITAWLVLHPITHPENLHFTAYCTIVEVNTLFSVFKKVWKKSWLNTGFAVSWIGMRLILYPYLVYVFYARIRSQGYAPTSAVFLQVVGSQVALCVLNFLWTGEAALKALKPKKDKAS